MLEEVTPQWLTQEISSTPTNAEILPRRVEQLDHIPEVPWRNGGGNTRVIAVSAEGAPVWRVSIATVDDGAVFSPFPGIDHVHLPLVHGTIDLRIDGETVEPLPLDSDGAYRFDGASRS